MSLLLSDFFVENHELEELTVLVFRDDKTEQCNIFN